MDDPLLDMTKPNNWLLQPAAIRELQEFAHEMSIATPTVDLMREYKAVSDALDRLHAVAWRQMSVMCTETSAAISSV